MRSNGSEWKLFLTARVGDLEVAFRIISRVNNSQLDVVISHTHTEGEIDYFAIQI